MHADNKIKAKSKPNRSKILDNMTVKLYKAQHAVHCFFSVLLGNMLF